MVVQSTDAAKIKAKVSVALSPVIPWPGPGSIALSLSLFFIMMMAVETSLTQQRRVPLSRCVVEKNRGCWTIILGSWFSTKHTLLSFWPIIMLATLTCDAILSTQYSMIQIMQSYIKTCREAWSVVQHRSLLWFSSGCGKGSTRGNRAPTRIVWWVWKHGAQILFFLCKSAHPFGKTWYTYMYLHGGFAGWNIC